MPATDYLKYYALEAFLFETVHDRFHADKSVGAFDFFSIVIWKANRAKSKIARRLLSKAQNADEGLDPIARRLTASLYHAPDDRERLRILLHDWGFLLPMASAILTVLWPASFTIYDIRVCDELGAFHKLGDWTDFDRVWPAYQDYRSKLHQLAPAGLPLRDADRYLWGRSAARQLERDIQVRFPAGA